MMEYINDRQILILYGLRRVGKTTLLYQFIDELLSRGVKAEHILYFSFDEIETKIDDLILAHEENILRSPIGDAGKIYLILDEIQKAKDWGNRVKIFYDLHPNLWSLFPGQRPLMLNEGPERLSQGAFIPFILAR
jgi:predicted AAA+ superfamily ATPase